jgi:hypothetical protein
MIARSQRSRIPETGRCIGVVGELLSTYLRFSYGGYS